MSLSQQLLQDWQKQQGNEAGNALDTQRSSSSVRLLQSMQAGTFKDQPQFKPIGDTAAPTGQPQKPSFFQNVGQSLSNFTKGFTGLFSRPEAPTLPDSVLESIQKLSDTPEGKAKFSVDPNMIDGFDLNVQTAAGSAELSDDAKAVITHYQLKQKETEAQKVQAARTKYDQLFQQYEQLGNEIMQLPENKRVEKVAELTSIQEQLNWYNKYFENPRGMDAEDWISLEQKRRTYLDPEYTEPGVFGQAAEGLKRGSVNMLSSFGAAMEMMGYNLMIPVMIEKGKEMSLHYEGVIAQNPEWLAPEDLKAWKDPRWYATNIGEGVPTVLGGTAAGLVAAGATVLTGGGTLVAGGIGLGTSFLYGFGLEGGSQYKEAKEFGLTEEEARRTGNTVGVINGLLELVPLDDAIRALRVMGRPVAKEVTQELAVSLTKQLARYSKELSFDFARGAFYEGGEEAMQTVVQNAVASSYDEDRGIWDGFIEALFFGGVLGGTSRVGLRPAMDAYNLVRPVTTEQLTVHQDLIHDPDQSPSGMILANNESEVFLRLTPEQFEYFKNELDTIPVSEGDVPVLQPMSVLEEQGFKEISLEELRSISPNVDKAFKGFEAGGLTEATTDTQDRTFDYSSTQLNLPVAEAQKVSEFANSIPEQELNTEEGGRESEPHVTVLYGLETTDQADIAPLLEGVEPIEVELGDVSVFENEGYDVLKIDVISKQLEDLHAKIDEALDTPGNNFPDYQPHVTIAYLKPEASAKYVGDNRFKGTKITLNELNFNTKDGQQFTIPLTGKATESVQDAQVTGSTPQEQEAGNVQERTSYAEDSDTVVRVANKKMFRGSKGEVKQVKKTFAKTLVIDTNQFDLMHKLADMGNVAAKEHVDSIPEGVTKVEFRIADPIIREAYQDSYDAIQYKNEQMPQIGNEWHDLKNNQFFAEEKLVAEQYAKQNRGGKYKPTQRQQAAAQADQLSPTIEKLAKDSNSYSDFELAVLNNSNMSADPRIQTIQVNKIRSTDYLELDDALANNTKLTLDQAEAMVSPTDPYIEGQQVTMPIEVRDEGDGSYSLVAGNHRLVQTLINGEKTIDANVVGDRSGKSLKDIYNEITNKPKEKAKKKRKKTTKKSDSKKVPGAKKQPKTEYKRGQITKLERQLDEMLGTEGFIASGKWQARLAARQTAREQLEYYAEQGDPSAIKYLQQVEDVESAIADARTAREIQLEERKKVKEFDSVNSGVSEQNALASKGAEKLHNFELRAKPQEGTPEFKLYQKVQDLIAKYAQSIGEGYTPRGALGVYFNKTKNIRVNAVNDLSVVSHEVAHFLDYAHNISERLDAKANKLDKTLTKQLEDLYVQYYPGAKDTHSKRLKRVEGFATLLQKYTEMPTTITNQYPELVNEFLKPGGKHYHKVIGDILTDLNNIISNYQGLSSLDRIGARVSSEGTGIEQKSFLNFWQKVRTQLADQVFPVEVIATKANKQMTAEDPSLWTRAYNAISGVINNNISTDRGYWSFTGIQEGFQKKFDYNWKTLIDSLENRKITDDFSYYLVARRQHETYLELDKLQGEYEIVKKINDEMQSIDTKKYAEDEKYRAKFRDMVAMLEDLGIEVTAANIERAKKNAAAATEEARKSYEDLKGILDRDAFSREDVDAAYEENKARFKDEEAMFDALSREDLNLLFHSDVQLIDKKKFTRLASKKGYASFKRQFYDEIVGSFDGEMQARVGSTRVSSMLARKGSQRTIINPLFSALQNHSEIMRKSMKQVVYNQVGKIGYSAVMPDLFQETQLKVAVDKETGAVSYPQEKDPNIIMTRRGYKRVPLLVNKEVKSVIDGVLDYKNIDTFTQLYTGMSRAFTAGTTGFYPAFALSNFVVDQMTATANSYNKFIPLYSPMSEMLKVLRNRSSIEAKYYEEYLVMGGERQTFTGWQKLTPKEMISRVNGEKKRMKQAIAALQKGTDILSMPAAKSEIFTRATEYINARKAGKSQVVALEEAGRVSAPFHHVGKWGGEKGETFVRGLPYFNATIQVLDQMSRVINTKSGRNRYAFMTLAISAAMISSMMALLNASDEQKEQYKDLEGEELARYIYLPSPTGKGLIRARMPENMTIPGAVINMIIADKMMGAKYDARDYVEAATAFLPDQFNPLDPAKQLLAWIPQIFKPTAHVIFNKKEYPRVTDLVNQGLSRKPAPLQFNEGTSYMAKKIGEWFNLSPIKVDYWITGTFGRASGFFMGKPGVYNPAKSFLRDHYFTSGRIVRDYYEKKEKVDGQYQAYQNFEKGFQDLSRDEVKEIYRVKMISDDVDDLLGEYRDIDIEENQEKAAEIRAEIYFLLERIEDGSVPRSFGSWANDAATRRRKNKSKK